MGGRQPLFLSSAPSSITGVTVTSVVFIDDQNVEVFFSNDVNTLPSQGFLINGSTPDGGYNTGSASNSILCQGSVGQFAHGQPWYLDQTTYDGDFIGATLDVSQSGTVP